MNLVQQNKVTERHLPVVGSGMPGLGLRLFGWKVPVGRWVGGVVRYLGGIVAGEARKIPIIGNKIAGEIDSLTNFVAENIETGFQQIGMNGKIFADSDKLVSTELSPSEEAILNKWLEKFNPYVKNLTQEAVNALALTDNNAMLTGINAVLNKINAVQDHYTITQEAGLSENALQQRSYVIYQAFNLIVTAITKGLESKNLNLSTKEVTFPINQYNYMPLFSSSQVSTVTGENYVLGGSGTKTEIPKTGGGKDVITLPGTVTTQPTKGQPVNTGGNTGINPNTGIPTTTDSNPVTTVTKEAKKVPSWLWWLLAGYGVYKIGKASGNNKKSKK